MGWKDLRLLHRIMRNAGAYQILGGYGVFFVVMALLIWLADPAVPTFRASLWYCFVAGTTIGFGDIAATTMLGRALTIILSVYSIVIVAILTAVITNFYLERARLRANDSASEFLDRLERLPELSREELEALSEQAKKYARNRRER